ncbi:right-handed parallel beta-helix repeat-containing protein [Aminobacter ciceronei]|uniref:Rhamnogalacturonase A/B/Epimerase-like pectate lyase domain-containing protein n=1 Tax=Aminobacter ciceronei TaxID=150723 RepID=A0ABR6CFV4_9HYPH|nr:right-handed parallel beta-helix repeat-containing protein [Aminobacter ciceronei]MBA8910142.1 hypothetical protein [Aminobacter ciceronei]MBA9023914.1 hypothetical protein [Aminobacter ciceronei]
MATEFDNSLHWGFFLTGTTLTSETGKYVRVSELVLSALRAAGVFSNMVDGTVAPATDKLWLDKNFDPAVLKEWDATGASWVPMTYGRLFGRAAVDKLTVTGGTGNAVVVSQPIGFQANRLYLVTPTADNSGATTINVAGVGTYAVKYGDGSDVGATEFTTGRQAVLFFTGARFEVVFPLNELSSAVLAAQAAQAAAEAAATSLNLPAIQPGDASKTLVIKQDASGYLLSRTWFNVLAFGAIGNGVADDTVAIQAAIDAAAAIGGGTVYFPASSYLVSEGSTATVAIMVSTNDIYLAGDGAGASIIRLANNQNCNIISVDGGASLLTGGGIRGLEIDGNRTNQNAGHGIRLDWASNFVIQDFYVHDAYHYGIGAQGGEISGVTITRGLIKDTGGDGIDFKNLEDINRANFISDVTVVNFGLDTVGSPTQAGIDCRGPVHISNIAISGAPADGTGVRFRQGELLDSMGFGAHRSSLKGFDIRMGAAATGLGVNVFARDVVVSDGYVSGGHRGVQVGELRCRVSQVTCEGTASEGFHTIESAPYEGDGAIFTACVALNNTLRGFRATADGTQFIGCQAIGNVGHGFLIDGAADGTKIIGGRANGNGANVGNSGTNTIIRNLEGFKTSANLISGSLTLDSTGSKTAVIPHGLGVTPALQDVALTFLRETAVADHGIAFLQVDGVDATNVNVRARVSTASATVGATFKIGVRIDALAG